MAKSTREMTALEGYKLFVARLDQERAAHPNGCDNHQPPPAAPAVREEEEPEELFYF